MHFCNSSSKFGEIGASFILKFVEIGATLNLENSERLEYPLLGHIFDAKLKPFKEEILTISIFQKGRNLT